MEISKIYELTSFLPDSEEYSLREREYFIKNNIKNTPTCVVCGGFVHSNGHSAGWNNATLSDTCSKECRQIFTKDPEKYITIPNVTYDDFTEHELGTLVSVSPAKLSQAYMKTNQHNKLYLKIRGATAFLDTFSPVAMSLRIKCILDKILEVPVCHECGNHIAYKGITEFKKYCSDECRLRNNNTLTPDTYAKLESYDWMYAHRVSKRMSQQEIGKLLGISESPVREYLIKHNLNNEKYNEAMPFAKSKLRNKEWLYEQHVVNRRKCEDIGNELGVSKSFVSVWLNTHGIEANDTNSYPRKFVKESKPQREIREYLQDLLGVDISAEEDKTILGKYGIDIVIPGSNICIEHHGLFRHAFNPEGKTVAQRKDVDYHRMKYVEAANKGYHLIQIFGDLWQYKKDIVKSILASKFGKTDKIYARKCKIVNVSTGIKNKFLEDNHIQGEDKTSIKLGLEHDGVLVAVMTFCKNKRNKSGNNPTWELCRYCSLKFLTVVGGFSKLFNNFLKNYDGDIISYSDCMWSNGSVYEKNGFILSHENCGKYHYIEPSGDKRAKHRSNFMKHKIADKNDPRSEEMIMEELGYRRIFDAGMKVWILKR